MDFLETRRQAREESELTIDNNFQYSIHSGELIIGGIFIRIFNEQPTYQIEVGRFRVCYFSFVFNLAFAESQAVRCGATEIPRRTIQRSATIGEYCIFCYD